jgi:hypothetical protein
MAGRPSINGAAAQPFATEAGAADAHLPPGSPPGRWRILDRLVVAGFALALVLPAAMLLARIHAKQVENRSPRELPALTAAGLLDETWPAGVDGFLTDRIALRPYAIRARGELFWLTGGTGTPAVVRGRDGWLFIRAEFEPVCRFSGAELGSSLVDAAHGLAAAGVEFRFLLVPDKHAVYPDKLGPGVPFGPSCADANRADFLAAIATLGPVAIDARPVLAQAREAAAADLYYAKDSHWAPSGAVAAIAALARSFPGLDWADSDVVEVGSVRRTMDLATFLGIRRVERTPKLEIRPGVTHQTADVEVPVEIHNARAIPRFTASGDRPTLPGRTLVIYDSFFGIDAPLVLPLFAESTWIHVGDLLNHPELAKILGPFDRVIFERVERGLYETDVRTFLSALVGSPGG